MSLFHCLGRLSKESVQVRGSCLFSVTGLFFYGEGLLAPRPTPKLEDHPLSSVCGCLFHVFAANLHHWRPSLYPRPEDAPCCGDRDPPNMVDYYISCENLTFRSVWASSLALLFIREISLFRWKAKCLFQGYCKQGCHKDPSCPLYCLICMYMIPLKLLGFI
jgi:hypothetical protein